MIRVQFPAAVFFFWGLITAGGNRIYLSQNYIKYIDNIDLPTNVAELYILGTIHSSSSSKQKLIETLNKEKFDVIFTEGVYGKPMPLTLLKEPILFLFIYPYFHFLAKKGSEFDLLWEIARKKKIQIQNIDYEINELVTIFHKWYNHIALLIILFWTYFVFVIQNVLRLPHLTHFCILLVEYHHSSFHRC